MKSLKENFLFKKIVTIIIITLLNLIFLLLLFLINNLLKKPAPDQTILLPYTIFLILPILPLLIIILIRVDSALGPLTYKGQYIKIINLILKTDSYEEILHHHFDNIIKIIRAESGRIISFYSENNISEIRYTRGQDHELIRREKTDYDQRVMNYIMGRSDIINRTDPSFIDENDERKKLIDDLNADLIVPVYYNNRVFGIIIISKKRRITENEIKLIRLVAHKLVMLSANNYYFSQIRKRKEVEKEYILTNRIQKQFYPDPDYKSGCIEIKAHHQTGLSLFTEFYDIFENDAHPDDIRLSVFSVTGDVKETSILMPGVQAVLQSYARLGLHPEESVRKLKELIRKKNILNGDLVIFHSSIRQSGELIYCSSRFPMPFHYRKQDKNIILLNNNEKYSRLTINPGDIIIIACRFYHNIISSDIQKYFNLIYENQSATLNEIKDLFLSSIRASFKAKDAGGNNENQNDEDKLLIIVGREAAS